MAPCWTNSVGPTLLIGLSTLGPLGHSNALQVGGVSNPNSRGMCWGFTQTLMNTSDLSQYLNLNN
ncbi:hypothetical protein PR003_g29524 [Phytophthora rubi]|uniref:Uncharacterized protein n=1 Tax=Phytophthora rubi TaxID=129364 RepID=A0A6A4BGV2_9STRA|nr:hypothetical protein PR001_g33959 [Phytophthora rubi]KAE8959425.1 hypothetical protein PR002_g30544 [Phytophthora rubi]KAE9274725.1 hypothetical protein PR003_g29524 [Phytophthora rubi]